MFSCFTDYYVPAKRECHSAHIVPLHVGWLYRWSQGHVEVYCNGQWETICDNAFSSTGAQTICKQL